MQSFAATYERVHCLVFEGRPRNRSQSRPTRSTATWRGLSSEDIVRNNQLNKSLRFSGVVLATCICLYLLTSDNFYFLLSLLFYAVYKLLSQTGGRCDSSIAVHPCCTIMSSMCQTSLHGCRSLLPTSSSISPASCAFILFHTRHFIIFTHRCSPVSYTHLTLPTIYSV